MLQQTVDCDFCAKFDSHVQCENCNFVKIGGKEGKKREDKREKKENARKRANEKNILTFISSMWLIVIIIL